MPFKFEQLEVWQRAVEYTDATYDLADQLRRAATSAALNIAEGSTGQTDAQQSKFLGYALRSVLETVACLHLIHRRNYVQREALRSVYREAETRAAKLQAFRNTLDPGKSWIREPAPGRDGMLIDGENPFEDNDDGR